LGPRACPCAALLAAARRTDGASERTSGGKWRVGRALMLHGGCEVPDTQRFVESGRSSLALAKPKKAIHLPVSALVHPRASANARAQPSLDDSRPPWTPNPDHLVRCAAAEHRRPYATPGTLTASDQPLERLGATFAPRLPTPPARGRPWRSALSRKRPSSWRLSGSAIRAGQRPRDRTLPRTSCRCEGAPQPLTLPAIATLGPEPLLCAHTHLIAVPVLRLRLSPSLRLRLHLC
jgi:hypothetical protein